MLYDDNGVGISNNLLLWVGSLYYSVGISIPACAAPLVPNDPYMACRQDSCYYKILPAFPLHFIALLALVIVKSGPGPMSRRARKIHRIEIGESYPTDDTQYTTPTPRDGSITVPEDSQDKVLFYSVPENHGLITLIKSIWHRIELSDPLKVSLVFIFIFYIIPMPFIIAYFFFPPNVYAIDPIMTIQVCLCSITWYVLAEF